MKRESVWMVAAAAVFVGNALMGNAELQVAVGDFEDLPVAGAGVKAYAGPGGGVFYDGSDLSGGYSTGGFFFTNTFSSGQFGDFWSGWTYSTTADVETPGAVNQYSAWAGAAASGSAYGIAFLPAEIALPDGYHQPDSVKVSLTTYTALSLKNGDAFARAFGDDPATTDVVETTFPDLLQVHIDALDAEGTELGRISVDLADYRFVNDGDDFIQAGWVEVNLAPLGEGVASLRMQLESTDVGSFGINTPSYIAIDDIQASGLWWLDYPVAVGGYFDTGDFLGFVYPVGDYVFVVDLDKWLYVLPDGSEDPSGSWLWVPKD